MDADFTVDVNRLTPWALALDLARATMGSDERGYEPSSDWKRRLIAAEHSPLRAVMYLVTLRRIPSWVSVHLVRHSKFAEHFVSTQRPDRTGGDVPRGELPQGALVDHRIFTNAQELLFISRRRLCRQASPETREVWQAVVDRLRAVDPELAEACVPMCAYRGGRCHEFRPCGLAQGERI